MAKCPRCGESQTAVAYCVQDDDGTCVRFESAFVFHNPFAA